MKGNALWKAEDLMEMNSGNAMIQTMRCRPTSSYDGRAQWEAHGVYNIYTRKRFCVSSFGC
jgi:hypothetical protein